MKDGMTTKIFNTIDDKFAVVVEGLDRPTISTIHLRLDSFNNFQEMLTQRNEGYTPQFVEPLFQCINETMGFRGCHVQLILENGDQIEIEQSKTSFNRTETNIILLIGKIIYASTIKLKQMIISVPSLVSPELLTTFLKKSPLIPLNQPSLLISVFIQHSNK